MGKQRGPFLGEEDTATWTVWGELAGTCPDCNTENPPDFGFCGDCGTNLDESADTVFHENAASEATSDGEKITNPSAMVAETDPVQWR